MIVMGGTARPGGSFDNRDVRVMILIIVSLAGFATGAVTARRLRRSRVAPPVHPFEVVLAAMALTGIILLRPLQQRISYAVVCAAVMVGIGILAAHTGGAGKPFVMAGTQEFAGTHAAQSCANAWERYLSFSRAVVDYEFRVVLTATYLLLVAPIALASRAGRRGGAQRSSSSNWLPRNDSAHLDSARRPF